MAVEDIPSIIQVLLDPSLINVIDPNRTDDAALPNTSTPVVLGLKSQVAEPEILAWNAK